MASTNLYNIKVGDYIQLKPQLVKVVMSDGVYTSHHYFDENQIEKVLPPALKVGDKVYVAYVCQEARVLHMIDNYAWVQYYNADFSPEICPLNQLKKA